MTTRPKWLIREATRLLGYGLLFTLLVLAAARLTGWVISVHPEVGWTGETSVVALDDGPPPALLPNDFPPDAEVRNVVLLIADGMGFPHITAARSELGHLGRRLSFERMPITGWLTTHDVGSIITDSAASATALATGVKTAAGRLGKAPDDRVLETVAEAARDRGLAVGAVTDTYLWDATPGGFLTHVASRRDYAEVAAQMARSGAELLFGEATWKAGDEDDGDRAILAAFSDQGYAVARDWAEVERSGAAGGKLVGLFDSGAVADPERPPSLPELARFALDRLAAQPGGFFLLVETEETDTASHRRQLQRMVRGMTALDTIVAEVLDFARRDRSTLVLVTADHETGGLSLVSGDYGNRLGLLWTTGNHSGGAVPLFAYGPGAERFGGARDNTEVAVILSQLLGLPPD